MMATGSHTSTGRKAESTIREGIKTQFTQAEIEKLKEKYSTDLRDFEIIEVKNGKDNI